MQDNGWIVRQEPVELDAPTMTRLEGHDPDIREVCRRVTLSRITYVSDGLRVAGYLAVPRFGDTHPCLIFNRGGQGDFGALNDPSAVMYLSRLAAQGAVVVASQYRGCAGSEGHDEFGGADVADVLNLLPLLDALDAADTTRIGMWGFSRGCLTTYRALTLTDRVTAAVCWSGLSDLDAGLRERGMEDLLAERVPAFRTHRSREVAARSPVQWAADLCKTTPILLVHGASDERSNPMTQGIAMAEALLACGHPFRFVLLDGADHGLAPHTAEAEAMLRAWFERHLAPWTPHDAR